MPRSVQDDERPDQHKACWRVPVILLVIAGIVRAIVVFAGIGGLEEDPDAYRKLAENLRAHGYYGWEEIANGESIVRPTAFRPPLYPLLLAAVAVDGQVTPSAVGWLHVLVGAATVGFTYALSQAWGLGRWAVVASLLVTIDPILLNQSCEVMTETIATFLAVCSLYFLTKLGRDATLLHCFAAGTALALSVLCRPTFLPWLGLAALYVTARALRAGRFGSATRGNRERDPSRARPQALVFILCCVIVLAPWSVRNYHALGRPKLTTTHGGYTVLLGNNPSFYDFLRSGDRATVWDASTFADAWNARHLTTGPDDSGWLDIGGLAAKGRQEPATVERSELDDDRFAYQLAVRYIKDSPSMFAYSCAVRIGRLWRWVPHRLAGSEPVVRSLARYAVGAWYGSVFLLAATGAIANLRRTLTTPWVWGVWLCVVFSSVHAMYWSNMRMRAPLIPFICLLASAGLAAIWPWVSGNKSPSGSDLGPLGSV